MDILSPLSAQLIISSVDFNQRYKQILILAIQVLRGGWGWKINTRKSSAGHGHGVVVSREGDYF